MKHQLLYLHSSNPKNYVLKGLVVYNKVLSIYLPNDTTEPRHVTDSCRSYKYLPTLKLCYYFNCNVAGMSLVYRLVT